MTKITPLSSLVRKAIPRECLKNPLSVNKDKNTNPVVVFSQLNLNCHPIVFYFP